MLDVATGRKVIAVVREKQIELWDVATSKLMKAAPFKYTRSRDVSGRDRVKNSLLTSTLRWGQHRMCSASALSPGEPAIRPTCPNSTEYFLSRLRVCVP